MATNELKSIIDKLPDIAKYGEFSPECYAFSNKYDPYAEVLLTTGELVIADARVNHGSIAYLKEYLKQNLGDDVTYLGKGVVHKHLR